MGGGGARGAYESGVLSGLRDYVFPHLSSLPNFEILVGTSAGALNALYLAGHADRLETGLKKLRLMWEALELEDSVVPSSMGSIAFFRWIFGQHQDEQVGLLDPSYLQGEISKRFPWRRIDYLIDMGHFQSICMPATHLSSGNVALFVQSSLDNLPDLPRGNRLYWERVSVKPIHAFASSSVPLFFPVSRIGGNLYCDGGLRQNMPITPALVLGGKKILTIGVKKKVPFVEQEGSLSVPKGKYPSAPDLFGKMMDAMLLDPLEREVSKIRLLKQLLQKAEEQYGARFSRRMASLLDSYIGSNLLDIDLYHQRPTRDLGAVAANHAQKIRERIKGIFGNIIHGLAEGHLTGDWDLASFLLFDREYARELVQLGKEDVRNNQEAYIEFFAK